MVFQVQLIYSLGRVDMIGVPLVMSACPGFVAGPPPAVGQDNATLAAALEPSSVEECKYTGPLYNPSSQ